MRVPSAIGLGSMTLLSLAAAATGCFSDRGLAIEVDLGDPRIQGVQAVALYVGEIQCGSVSDIPCPACPTILGGDPSPGCDVWWPRDRRFRDAAEPYPATVTGGTATLQLRAATPTSLPILIAVGFSSVDDSTYEARAVATLRQVEVPVDSARVVTAKASPVNDAQDPSGFRVRVLPEATPRSPCVFVDRAGQRGDFVVLSNDPLTECQQFSEPPPLRATAGTTP